jgi:hypothetical protein
MASSSPREAIAARARRLALIRRRVVAATLAAFVLAWGVIAFDGSMGAEAASTATASAAAADGGSSASSSAADGGSSASAAGTNDDSGLAPTTTAQS